MRALLDLLFPAVCVGCDRGDAVVCSGCADALRAPARARWPSPAPPGLPTPYAVADYAGAARRLVVDYKEHDRLVLTSALSRALAASVAAAAVHARAHAPALTTLAIVPVPSSRAARRRRGFDPVLRLARAAVLQLHASGEPAEVVPALRHVRAVRDSAGLSAVERADNLARAFAAEQGAISALVRRAVIVVDDVVTTGATIAEAARALRAESVAVDAAAVIAATVRRPGLVQKGLHNGRSQHYGAGRAPTTGGTAWTSS